MTLLGRVSTDKPSSLESTPKKKKRSDGSPKSSKRRHCSKPISDDLKSLDDKWSERFSRLEALLLNKSFAVPVRPVNPSAVVTREHPFFDPAVPAQLGQSGVSTIQPDPAQEPVKPEPTCVAPRATAIKEHGFSEAVAELRLLKEDQPDPSMRQSGPFLQSGA